ncbi:MAG: TetR/AcrR family transcriptional regulator [Pseudomonadota bacterium]
MTETEEKIIKAAIAVFVRFGAKKTTMADIAETAEVSRQTVYALFGDKDGMIVASIRYVTDRSLSAARSKLAGAPSLSEQLDIYFAETVTKSFELLQTSGDADDLISGHNKAGKAEIERSHQRHKELVSELLAPHDAAFMKAGQSYLELSNYVVTVAMALKYGAADRAEFDALLLSLKNSVLCLAGSNEP